jgi:hypothetical protein
MTKGHNQWTLSFRVAGQIGPKQNRPQVKSDQVKSAPDQIIVLLCFFYLIW